MNVLVWVRMVIDLDLKELKLLDRIANALVIANVGVILSKK